MLKGRCWRRIRRHWGQSPLLRRSWVLVVLRVCVMTMDAALRMADAAIDPFVLVLPLLSPLLALPIVVTVVALL
jgi:hypothetical protein